MFSQLSATPLKTRPAGDDAGNAALPVQENNSADFLAERANGLRASNLQERAILLGLNPEQSGYTVAEAAKALRVSRSWIYALKDAGKLACYKVGTKAVRFSLLALVEYLEAIQRDNEEANQDADQNACKPDKLSLPSDVLDGESLNGESLNGGER